MNPSPHAPPWWLPSLALLLLMIAMTYGFWAPVYSGDLGWQIRAGQALLEHGDVPRVNTLTFTAPLHIWVAHEWATGLLFALMDRLDGIAGLLLLRGLFFGAMLASIYHLGRRLGACPLALALWMVPTGVLMALHTALRPWFISNILVVLILYICHRASRDWRFLFVIPPLFALWAPFHAGYVWGAVIVSAYGLQWLKDGGQQGGPTRSIVFVAALLSIGGLLLGPYGTEALVFPFRYFARDPNSGIALMYQAVKEWAPPDLTSFFGVMLLLNGFVTVVALLRLKEQRLALWLIVLPFFLMALRVQRHIPMFVLVSMVPITLGLLKPIRLWSEEKRGRWWGVAQVEGQSRKPLGAILTLVLTLGAFGASRAQSYGDSRLHAHGYPVEGAKALQGLPGGNLLNHYDWGGYLPWQAPGWRVFITPVPDSYPAQVFGDWLTLANMKPGWEQVLAKYDIDAVAFPPSSALVQTLANTPGWQVFYEDAYALILTKSPGE